MVYSTTCKVCGADLTKAGFYQCTFCRSYFCDKHRAPEAHNCNVLREAKHERRGLFGIFRKKEKPEQETTSASLRHKVSRRRKANHNSEK